MLSPIDEIKNRLDVVEVIKSYIKLQKAGVNYRGLCPFHSEKKPSFFVSPARQIWHCFGCGVGGGIFDFVMKIEGVEFGDALRVLAQKAGVELKKPSPELVQLQTEKTAFYEICELATQFFEKQLGSKTGQEVKKYLLERGINKESIKKWRLGWAPDVWQGLSDFLVSKGYQKEKIEKAGLIIKSETTGNFYDRFRGRIIFPISDLNSQVVGFSGRIFGSKSKDDIAKYVNTPNTLLYDKSRVLYGLDKAKLEIRRTDSCILVEGQTDAVLAHQAGFENVVATSGTALTLHQLRTLKRYSENLLTAFDMDVAGDSATKRGIDLAQTQEFSIKVIHLPEGSDPADIISKNPKDWEKFVKEARSILEFYFESTFSRIDFKNPEGKKQISKVLLPVIKRIPNKIEQAYWVQQLAKKLEVKEEVVEEELKKVSFSESSLVEEPQTLDKEPKSRKEMLEEKIISLILKKPRCLDFIEKSDFPIFSEKIQKILKKFKQDPNQCSLANKFEGWDSESSEFLNYLSLKSEVEEEAEPEREIRICLKAIQLSQVKKDLDKISQQIKGAEEEKDAKKANLLTQQFNKLATELAKKE